MKYYDAEPRDYRLLNGQDDTNPPVIWFESDVGSKKDKPDHEIYTSFERAKVAAEEILKIKIEELEKSLCNQRKRLKELSEMTAKSCPEGEDPYNGHGF